MSIWWLAPILALNLISSAQQSENKVRSAPADLIPPLAGSPLSVQQIDERVRNMNDGGTTLEIVRSTINRDSTGRLRIESVYDNGTQASDVFLIEPTSGLKIVLSAATKIAYRISGPRIGEVGFVRGIGGMGDALPSGVWKINTEKLGRRTIEGIEVEGERVTQVSSNQPSQIAVYERWYSNELKLTSLATTSGAYGTHTARIHNLNRVEPDPSLFIIPPDYKVEDVRFPTQSQ